MRWERRAWYQGPSLWKNVPAPRGEQVSSGQPLTGQAEEDRLRLGCQVARGQARKGSLA